MRIRYSRSQPGDDFLRCLLARELAEVFLDVLNFERARIKRILFDQVLQRLAPIA
jgi:hypothetical protein